MKNVYAAGYATRLTAWPQRSEPVRLARPFPTMPLFSKSIMRTIIDRWGIKTHVFKTRSLAGNRTPVARLLSRTIRSRDAPTNPVSLHIRESNRSRMADDEERGTVIKFDPAAERKKKLNG